MWVLQTKSKKDKSTFTTLFFEAGGTLHAKHAIQPAPTPAKTSSSWSFRVELSWSHAKQDHNGH
jgi:hypothetical protein